MSPIYTSPFESEILEVFPSVATLYKTLRGIEFEDVWRLATANTEDGA